MAAVIEFGQRRLDRAVAAVDDQHLGPHPRDGPHRLADLAGVLDLIVEDVGMLGTISADARQLGEIAGRLGIGQQAIRGRIAAAAARRMPRPDGRMLAWRGALFGSLRTASHRHIIRAGAVRV